MPAPPARPVVSVSRKTARRRSKPASSGSAVSTPTVSGATEWKRDSGTSPCRISRWTELSTRKNSPRSFSTRIPSTSSSSGSGAGPRLRSRRAATATSRSSRAFSGRYSSETGGFSPSSSRSSRSRPGTAARLPQPLKAFVELCHCPCANSVRVMPEATRSGTSCVTHARPKRLDARSRPVGCGLRRPEPRAGEPAFMSRSASGQCLSSPESVQDRERHLLARAPYLSAGPTHDGQPSLHAQAAISARLSASSRSWSL